jgi:hypothetical protein
VTVVHTIELVLETLAAISGRGPLSGHVYGPQYSPLLQRTVRRCACHCVRDVFLQRRACVFTVGTAPIMLIAGHVEIGAMGEGHGCLVHCWYCNSKYRGKSSQALATVNTMEKQTDTEETGIYQAIRPLSASRLPSIS